LASNCFARFYIQYDNSGHIICTVQADKRPNVIDRNQISYESYIDTFGKMIDLSKVVNGGCYNLQYQSDKIKVDPDFKSVDE